MRVLFGVQNVFYSVFKPYVIPKPKLLSSKIHVILHHCRAAKFRICAIDKLVAGYIVFL